MGDFNVTSLKKLMPQADNGVYIQDINGKLWETEDWDNSVKPNAIAIITDETKFLMALEQSDLQISNTCQTEFEEHMYAASASHAAISDYDGAGNTARMLKVQPRTDYAAGYCNAFTFPNGKTKGYLPSLGQLYLACMNKGKVNAALSKCGGTVMGIPYVYYWSSTFWGNNRYGYRNCWMLYWSDGSVYKGYLNSSYHVRPFADLT